ITNLSLESEYIEALRLLDDVARRTEVTVVPGNHDAYLAGIQRQRRFPRYFGRFLVSDLPDLAVDLPIGRYPCVKLRGAVAIIALSSAVPRPPFIAAGQVGDPQLAVLKQILAHPEVARRTPVVLIHHPPVDGRVRLAQLRDGLVDAAALRSALAPLARGLVLCGHLHVRVRWVLRTAAGALDVICASGTALDHPDSTIRAGYNLYDIDDEGAIARVEARVLDPDGVTLRPTAIPLAPGGA
ncbi:MAG TPA: metallophosphoesterase, partial [Gemmatimonadaceae bacterium]|nr:metallophosphoesterase [Gemmatimonadaceae bacterium]